MNNYPVKVLPVNAAIVFLQPLLKKGRRSLTKRFENHDKKSVENAEIDFTSAKRVKNRVEDHRLERAVRIPFRGIDPVNYGIQNFLNTEAFLGAKVSAPTILKTRPAPRQRPFPKMTG